MTTVGGSTRLTRYSGYSIPCAAGDCRAQTGDQAPSRFVRTAELAVRTAKLLGWIHAQREPGTPHVWFCPLHQRYDEGSGSWVPTVPVRGRA